VASRFHQRRDVQGDLLGEWKKDGSRNSLAVLPCRSQTSGWDSVEIFWANRWVFENFPCETT
jgi:hypothetical protein